MKHWAFSGRTTRLGWFGKLSWLGRLNYYVLQWSGYRLAALAETSESTEVVGWKFVRFPAGEGWLK